MWTINNGGSIMLLFIASAIFFILSVAFLFSVIQIPNISEVEKLLFSMLISFLVILVIILFAVIVAIILCAANVSFIFA